MMTTAAALPEAKVPSGSAEVAEADEQPCLTSHSHWATPAAGVCRLSRGHDGLHEGWCGHEYSHQFDLGAPIRKSSDSGSHS